MSELVDKKTKFLAQFSPNKNERVTIVTQLLETNQITPKDIVKDKQDNILRYKKHHNRFTDYFIDYDINYMYPDILDEYQETLANNIAINARYRLLQIMIQRVTDEYLTEIIGIITNEN